MFERTAARRARLAERLAAADVDAALVTRLVNVRYLTGFTGSAGALLLSAAGVAVLATDGRYTIQAGEQAPDVELVTSRSAAADLLTRAAGAGAGRVGFEDHAMTVAEHRELTGQADGVELVPLDRPVETLRAVKDDDELDLLRRACAIADRALADLLPEIRPGLTERVLGRRLDERMREYGADGPAFETIVGAGPNSAIPHHRPGERPLAAGDLLVLDFGARLDGYHSDMTRTFVLGEPAGWQRELHDLVRAAQRAGRRALAPGAELAAVDEAARSVIEQAGQGERFPHGLGHGVGLEIHEAPMLGRRAAGTLDDRTPVTVEPGVYLAGRGGVRIEDTLVVRADGPESLTTTTRDLTVLT